MIKKIWGLFNIFMIIFTFIIKVMMSIMPIFIATLLTLSLENIITIQYEIIVSIFIFIIFFVIVVLLEEPTRRQINEDFEREKEDAE